MTSIFNDLLSVIDQDYPFIQGLGNPHGIHEILDFGDLDQFGEIYLVGAFKRGHGDSSGQDQKIHLMK